MVYFLKVTVIKVIAQNDLERKEKQTRGFFSINQWCIKKLKQNGIAEL